MLNTLIAQTNVSVTVNFETHTFIAVSLTPISSYIDDNI
jgi:hypothetical protein